MSEIDEALLALRRLWVPTTSGRPARGTTPAVDLSTVLVVHAVGGAEGGVTIAEAASRLQVATTTASRLCDQAVKGGYLIKATSAKDARQRVLTLTTQGHQLRLESETFRHGYLRRILEDWTNDDINAFTALLSRFASTVAAHPPPRAASAPRG